MGSEEKQGEEVRGQKSDESGQIAADSRFN